MNEVEQVSREMQRHFFDLISALQTTKEIKSESFEAADRAARQLAVLLKGQDLLPRRALYDLDMAAGILENEAPTSRDEQRVLAMSRALRFTFGLILCGESHEDRKSGVPRVR